MFFGPSETGSHSMYALCTGQQWAPFCTKQPVMASLAWQRQIGASRCSGPVLLPALAQQRSFARRCASVPSPLVSQCRHNLTARRAVPIGGRRVARVLAQAAPSATQLVTRTTQPSSGLTKSDAIRYLFVVRVPQQAGHQTRAWQRERAADR